VDDFYTYGNVDDLAKYLKKAQTLNTKLELCREKIDQGPILRNSISAKNLSGQIFYFSKQKKIIP
jgi:hypothetical protein